MRPASPFTAVAAVESWDTWFRWRDAGGLRDRTIEATWWRVARAVAGVEGNAADSWSRRWFDAFARWRLLPDEALLRGAGTRRTDLPAAPLSATLNAGGFVQGARPAFDFAAFADTAALAVRLLDGARLAGLDAAGEPGAVRVGLLGLADALDALGLDYDSDAACDFAARVAAAMARGALRGAIELAHERGAATNTTLATALRASAVADPALAEDLQRWGTRFARLTAIAPQPRLARLANGATDALDPRPATQPPPDLLAQLRLRAAMQPWIDAPIDHPCSVAGPRTPEQLHEAEAFAAAHGLSLPALVVGASPSSA